jgi:hypothetical protein
MNTGTCRPLALNTPIVSSPEPTFRVDGVAGRGLRVVAVFSDQQNTVHRQLPAPQCQRPGDGRKDGKPVGARKGAADVARRNLIGVKRHQLQRRFPALAVEGIGLQQPADDDVGVRIVAVLGNDGGHLRTPAAPQVVEQVEQVVFL